MSVAYANSGQSLSFACIACESSSLEVLCSVARKKKTFVNRVLADIMPQINCRARWVCFDFI